MAHEVFISHSSLDKPVADAVCAALENTAIGCWIAPRDVLPGRSFAGEITRAIQRSKVMVLIFSAHSNTSEQILREVQLAANSHLPIVPFRIEDVLPNEDLEYYLSAPQWLDALTPPLERNLQRLGTSLKALLEMAVEDPAKRAMAPVAPSVDSRPGRSQQHSVAIAKEPTPPVKSAQTTLITTFICNMLLNWLVLISWLAAAMMIPRLYLAAIMVSPNWSTWTASVEQYWDIGLTVVLAVGFALVAMAMASAIIDVPSTGNARLSQRRFLWVRQLPLLLASLILAEWWAVFRNVHGSEPFEPLRLWPKFVAFFVASYLCGGVLAVAILCFRKRKQKAGRGRPTHSLRRLGTIALAAAIAGSCVCMMATRMPAPAKHALNYVCFAPALLLAVLLLVNFRVTKDEDREWWGRSGAWILITILGWIVFNVMVLWGAQAIATTGNQLAVFLGHVKANPVAKASSVRS
jgi:hypothetical protein